MPVTSICYGSSIAIGTNIPMYSIGAMILVILNDRRQQEELDKVDQINSENMTNYADSLPTYEKTIWT